LEQLKPLSLQHSAYREIKRRIVTAVYRPGEQINTAQICAQLRIGRTPVHLAIHRLETEGLIEILPRRGIVVKPIDRAQMMELIEARHMIEPEVAALASARASDREFATMREILDRIPAIAESGDSEQFMGRKGTLVMTEQSGKSLMFREPGVEEIGFEKASENKTKVNGKNAIVLDAGATTKQDKRERTAGQGLASTGTAGKSNWHLALEDWVDCIRTGRKPFCDGRIGLADTVCVIAANEAMEKGTKVRITEEMFKA
jgi:DNA-binding transcriptional regulator YhcF (GntR family)